MLNELWLISNVLPLTSNINEQLVYGEESHLQCQHMLQVTTQLSLEVPGTEKK